MAGKFPNGFPVNSQQIPKQNRRKFPMNSQQIPNQFWINSLLLVPAPVSASCPKPEAPAFGRRLGRVFGVGHEVHFLCKPGHELIGPRTRKCLESLRWSGRQPQCRRKRRNRLSAEVAALRVSELSPSSFSRFERDWRRLPLLLSQSLHHPTSTSSPLVSDHHPSYRRLRPSVPLYSPPGLHALHLRRGLRHLRPGQRRLHGWAHPFPAVAAAAAAWWPFFWPTPPPGVSRRGRVPPVSSGSAGPPLRPPLCQHPWELPLRLSGWLPPRRRQPHLRRSEVKDGRVGGPGGAQASWFLLVPSSPAVSVLRCGRVREAQPQLHGAAAVCQHLRRFPLRGGQVPRPQERHLHKDLARVRARESIEI